MKTGLHIDNNESTDAAANAILAILRTGHDTHADQKTIRLALEALKSCSKVESVQISNCTFQDYGNKE